MRKIIGNTFVTARNIFVEIYDIFKSRKSEFVLIIIGVILSYLIFDYWDGLTLTGWSLNFWDAFFRGGFDNFSEIMAQNIWHAWAGAVDLPELSTCVWGVWNIPILIIHYIFNTACEVTTPVLLWSRSFLVILVLATGFICYRIVYKLTEDKSRGMLAFILVSGSSTLMFLSVTYAVQNEILYIFCMTVSLYKIVLGRKNRALIWMCVAALFYPPTVLYSILIIIASSKKVFEIIVRICCILGVVALYTALLLPGGNDEATSEFRRVFQRAGFLIGNGYMSILAVVIVIVYLVQFFSNREEPDENFRYMFFYLAVIAIFQCSFANLQIYRFGTYVPFLVISSLIVNNKNNMSSSVMSLCLFEVLRFIIACDSSWCLSFRAIYPSIVDAFGWEFCFRRNDFSLMQMLQYKFPFISAVTVVSNGVAVACGICLLLIIFPGQKKEFHCRISDRFMTIAWCSVSIVATCMMIFIMATTVYLNIGIDSYDALEIPVNGINYLEEYYKGRDASSVEITLRPVTWGRDFPDEQKICLDLIRADTEEVVASTEWNADDMGDNQPFTVRFDDVEIKKDEWYIFRVYSPEIIYDSQYNIRFLHSDNGSADPERHYAKIYIDGENGIESFEANYDIVSTIITEQ